MTSMYITAAPIGAVPKWINPLEPTFIPSYLLQLIDGSESARILAQLQADGWEAVPHGGMLLTRGHDSFIADSWLEQHADAGTARQTLESEGWLRRDHAWHAPQTSAAEATTLPHEWLMDVKSMPLVRQIVLQLTTYGWVVSERGDLIWEHAKLHSYFPPALIDSIRENCQPLLRKMEGCGWQVCGAGYWQPGKARSPFLPISPMDIVEESIRSLEEGAAVVHLHTRELADRRQIEIPGLGQITVGSQRNQIVLEHYDQIVPAVKARDASAILNLSTSVRGDRQSARSDLRRAHLKSYGDADVPEMASLSPAAVIFQGGGGYDNAPDFLAAQFTHFWRTGTRPEVEVFNHTIVDNATTLYREHLDAAGKPVLFMLVAGVDQYRRDPITGEVEDDSLIEPACRQEIGKLLSIGDLAHRERAVSIAAEQLQPVVERLRNIFPTGKISILLPGPMQVMLADVALSLGLDGVRVGLEDGLNVYDSRAPGGVRKARGTWEQVRMLREALHAKGIAVQTSAQVRDMLSMPIGAVGSQKLAHQ
ncbi:hypothetical protein D1006_37190 [Burkholderia stabilis]|uniref:Oxalate Biosynthetic Component A N-terminal domain-containing protein n=1 Tax=Burkholderia stabilis TaxID=95485 RepID=A0A4Q2A8S2_9BURK|nr:3-keto-5-aminohexanoate cleavage protein [Burkholderia stabilis]RXV65663.1 hypothetical protein D1006_37190 [Burkholderia stabilis]